MSSTTYAASKNKSQGREAWCATFRHPLRRDADGKPLRVRRGLGTADEAEADRLVDQLNKLLADESFWRVSAREHATREFDPRVVDIFYEHAEGHVVDAWAARDAALPLPGPAEGFARVQIVGSTGAGKTTLLRQLIGTDPNTERFPSTSTAKTTIFDTEIVLTEAPFRAVVAFLPQDRVRSLVEECVAAAAAASAAGEGVSVAARRLLEHREQRFRLSYILGSFRSAQEIESPTPSTPVSDAYLDDGQAAESDQGDEEAVEVDAEERTRLDGQLRGYLDRLTTMATSVARSVATKLAVDPTSLRPEDRDVFVELLEDEVAEDDAARALIDEIMDDIQSRFDRLDQGKLERDRSGWPHSWVFECDGRRQFVKVVNRFSSNYAPNFGRLLAPVVAGLRVAGPFRPQGIAENDHLPFVFIDGEGLGHTATSAASLPTTVTGRYDMVDVILLVDNAEQPMQAASQAVLRSVAASGHDAKLTIAFTHFDQVRGANLPNVKARVDHVTASLDNSLDAVEEAIGAGAGRRAKRRLAGRVFFLSSIQDQLEQQNRLSRKALTDLLDIFRSAVKAVERPAATPVYDLGNLVLAVHKAAGQFHESWNARLGLAPKPGVVPEHWTRVKALSRRLAFQWEDQYDTLRPVADLIKFVSERLAAFIATPREWRPLACTEAEKEIVLDRVAQEVYARLHKLAADRLFRDRVADWLSAYEERGTGSHRRRTQDIRGIYETAAPIPAEVPGRATADLLDSFRTLFREAAEKAEATIVA